MNKIKKEEKGITLVALVVTIIVLLILAGIAISLTIGNNGLFSRAQNAANTWRRAEANEQEEMSKFESLYDNTVKELGLDGSKVEDKNVYIYFNGELYATLDCSAYEAWSARLGEKFLEITGLLLYFNDGSNHEMMFWQGSQPVANFYYSDTIVKVGDPIHFGERYEFVAYD